MKIHLGWALLLAVAGCGADECTTGEAECSADALSLRTCVDGAWQDVGCMADGGQLCQAGACVDPWRYDSPTWSTCPDSTRATTESLSAKAAYYDAITARLHIHPTLKWAMGVDLAAGAAEATATYEDVERWLSGENDGLWSALMLAAQAFRYAVTGEAAALELVRTLVDGEVTRMEVTGVPGMFTRQFIPPGVDGITCPAEDEAYTVDEEKDDNRWVRVGSEGCAWVVDRENMMWTKTDHCGLDAFVDWCWLDNVSKDEYSGHMFALAIVRELVDDADVQAKVTSMLEQIGALLVANGLAVRDWDGRITEHGRFHPLAFDNFPGFNAAMSLSYLQSVLHATNDAELRSLYDRCLLMTDGPDDCFETGFIEILPFMDYLNEPGLYIGREACSTNYNNVSMHMLSMRTLVHEAHDPELRSLYQKSLNEDVFRATDEPRKIQVQHNAFFDFIFAAHKALGPGTDGPAYDAVEDGVCMLRQFPASKAVVAVEPDPALLAPYCKDRFDRDTGGVAKEVADRCIRNFVWWGDPYDLRECSAVDNRVEVPTDYLLAYWMGRYYGFIDAEM